MFNIEEKEKKTEFQILKEKSPDLIFKSEGLGVIEFTKDTVLKTFNREAVKYRIERIPTQVFSKFMDKGENLTIKDIGSILKSFIATPIEAREIEYFNLDMNTMSELIGIITEFQTTPFLYIEGTRGAKEGTSI